MLTNQHKNKLIYISNMLKHYDKQIKSANLLEVQYDKEFILKMITQVLTVNQLWLPVGSVKQLLQQCNNVYKYIQNTPDLAKTNLYRTGFTYIYSNCL